MSYWYKSGLNGIMDGTIDLDDDDLAVAVLDSTYVDSDTHTDYSDITASVIDTAALTGVAITDGVLTAGNVSPGPTIGIGETVVYMAIFKDALPDEGASTLVAFIDRNRDNSPISRPGEGAAVPITWDPAGILSLV